MNEEWRVSAALVWPKWHDIYCREGKDRQTSTGSIPQTLSSLLTVCPTGCRRSQAREKLMVAEMEYRKHLGPCYDVIVGTSDGT